MTRFLVLGAGGFLGRAICRGLEGHPGVEAIPHVRSGATGGLDLASASVDDVALLLLGSSADVVVNCIGAHTGTSDQLLDANVRVVARILAALSGRADIRLVQIGSAEEYGDSVEHRPFRESDPPHPVDDYGRTKLTATRLVLGTAGRGAVQGTVLRVFNPIGPGAPEQMLLGRAVRRIEEAQAIGSPTVHFGPLTEFRDYVDIRDVARAIVAAGTSPQASGALLNVGSGEAVQRRAFVQMLATEAGFNGAIVEDERASTRSPGVEWQRADITAIHTRLGWTPTHSLADSVHAVWHAHRTPC